MPINLVGVNCDILKYTSRVIGSANFFLLACFTVSKQYLNNTKNNSCAHELE